MLEQRKPVHGTAMMVEDSLVIRVNTATRGMVETFYRLNLIETDPSIGTAAYRLTKIGGGSSECYDLVKRPWGIECDCPEWIHARQHKDPRGCKHVLAAAAVNLFNTRMP